MVLLQTETIRWRMVIECYIRKLFFSSVFNCRCIINSRVPLCLWYDSFREIPRDTPWHQKRHTSIRSYALFSFYSDSFFPLWEGEGGKMNSFHCPSAGVVHILERCVPSQCFRCGAGYAGYAGHASCRTLAGEVLFKDTAVIIFFFVQRRIDGEPFGCMFHLFIADSGGGDIL